MDAHSGVGTAHYPRIGPRIAECAAKLKKRILTQLYNERPTWLANVHAKLDAAAADLKDDEILLRLLKLDCTRAAADQVPTTQPKKTAPGQGRKAN